MKTPEPLAPTEVIERAHALIDVLAGKRDTAELTELVTEGHELVQSAADLRRPPVGPERLAKLVRWYHAALSDWTVTIQDEQVDGHVCFLRAEVSVKHTGQLGLVAPHGERVTFCALLTVELLGAKVCRTVLFFDGLTLMRALSAFELVEPFPQGTSHE